MRRPLLLALHLAVATPALAIADDGVRAGQIQADAREAYDAGDVDEAMRLSNRAISLDPGPSTWLAQQIRIEILEERGELGEAMDHLRDYLDLDGLFPEHRAWGKEARERIRGRIEAARARRAQAANTQRGAGIALIGGGVVPLGVGIGFLAQYGSKASDPLFSEGWYDGFLDGGAALLAVGATLEVIGVVVAATAGGPPKQALAPRALPTLGFDGRALHVGVFGRF